MAHNPNDPIDPNDPKPVDSSDPNPPEGDAGGEVRFEDLPDLGPIDLAELGGELSHEEPTPESEVWTQPASPQPPPEATAPDVGTVSFGVTGRVDDHAEMSANEALEELMELPEVPVDESSSLFPRPDPLPPLNQAAEDPDASIHDAADVGKLEPPSAVAPASGWFDGPGHTPTTRDELLAKLAGSDSDLFGGRTGKPITEAGGSDIFSGGPPPVVNRGETSDVLVGAVFGEPEEPSAHSPPPSARVEPELEMVSGTENDGDHMLPEAQEVDEDDEPTVHDAVYEGSDSLFDMPGEGQLFEDLPTQLSSGEGEDDEDDGRTQRVADHGDSLFDVPDDGSLFDDDLDGATRVDELAAEPDQGLAGKGGDDPLHELGIVPDYGSTPELTPDASSILADLTEMKPRKHGGDSSDVRFEAPGMGRTVGGDENDGTEFDLTIGDQIPPELADVEAEAGPDWKSALPADMFGTMPEVALPEVPAPKSKSPRLEPTEALPAMSGDADDADAAVEFSDFPEAEDEASISRIFNPGSSVGQPATPPKPPSSARRPTPVETEDDFPELDPETDLQEIDPGTADWNLADDGPVAKGGKGSKPSVGLPGRGEKHDADAPTREAPKTPSGAGKGRGAALPTAGEEKSSNPSVEIDWMSGSLPEKAVQLDGPVEVADWNASAIHSKAEKMPVAAAAAPDAPTRPEAPPVPVWRNPEVEDHDDHDTHEEPGTEPARRREPEPRRGGKGGWVGGTLVGAVLAGGAFAGAYFGGFIPNGEKSASVAPVKPPGGDSAPVDPATPGSRPGPAPRTAEPTAADVGAAVRAGDAARAKELAAKIKDASPFVQAARGEAELFAVVQDPKLTGPVAADHPELKSARDKLQSLVTDPETANTPEGEKAAVKAAIQLGVAHQLSGDRQAAMRVYLDARTRFPKYAATFEAALDRLEVTAPEPAAAPMPDGNSRRDLAPADARRQLLLAIVLLQPEPAADDTREAGDYFWTAVKKAKAEEFADAIELIKKAKAAHARQAKAAAGRGLNPLSDPLEQIFPRCCDDLKAYWELRAAIYENKGVAELIKKNGTPKALAELEAAQKKAADAVKLATDLKDATDKLKDSGDKLKDATDKLTVANKDLKEATDLVTKLGKDVKDAADAKLAAEKKLEAEEKARKGADEIVSGVVKELQAAKLLPEKFDTAELLAAQKRATDRATGPTLSSLVNPGMIAVGGAGLSTAQLVDIAERLSKAESAARVATDKLAAETKRLVAEHADATKKVTADHADAMKKLADAHSVAVSKLKDDQTAELKKAADKFAADMKKLTEDYDGKIKALDSAVAKEKAAAKEAADKFKVELGNSVSPSQAIDLWLPLLSELRRPSDSEPALAAAAKALASTTADSEEAGKARTVAGLALLFQNKYTEAKAQFQAAKANPNYEAALKANKLWATAADVGIASVSDPLAAYRRLPELPPRDRAVAVRHLDAGVKAYKDGRLEEAVKALTEATKADAADPVAWYFLGASKWALGSTDQAKDDIRQGAAREAAVNVPTRTVSAALSPIQGAARDVITAARP